MNHNHIPKTVCSCGYELDAATETTGGRAAPSENDISICFKCGKVYIFNADLTQREATEKDLKDLSPDARDMLERAVTLIKEKNL